MNDLNDLLMKQTENMDGNGVSVKSYNTFQNPIFVFKCSITGPTKGTEQWAKTFVWDIKKPRVTKKMLIKAMYKIPFIKDFYEVAMILQLQHFSRSNVFPQTWKISFSILADLIKM